jgi:hypothetical protein
VPATTHFTRFVSQRSGIVLLLVAGRSAVERVLRCAELRCELCVNGFRVGQPTNWTVNRLARHNVVATNRWPVSGAGPGLRAAAYFLDRRVARRVGASAHVACSSRQVAVAVE